MVERRTCNADVIGSSPVRSSRKYDRFQEFSHRTKNSKFGLACTKAGEVPLQGTCGEFDSLRVHKYKTSIKEIYLSCRFCKKYVIDASVRSNLIVHFPMKVKESVEVESGADIFLLL